MRESIGELVFRSGLKELWIQQVEAGKPKRRVEGVVLGHEINKVHDNGPGNQDNIYI